MINVKRLGALSLSLALTLSALSGCQGDGGSSQSSSGSSSSQVEPMDLSQVTDPYLATAGIPGDTVVATVGDAEVTADSLLYWLVYLVDSSIQDTSAMGHHLGHRSGDRPDLPGGGPGRLAEQRGPVRSAPLPRPSGGADPLPGGAAAGE